MFLFVLSTLFNYAYAKDHGNGIVIHKDYYYKKSYSWYQAPKVIVCKDSPYNKKTVENAVSIWRKEGISILNVVLENNYNQCNSTSGKKGYIQIMGYRGSFKQSNYLAYTWDRTYLNNSSRTFGSEIEFANDVSNNNFNLLVHEIGHALGYEHYNHKYDIMNR